MRYTCIPACALLLLLPIVAVAQVVIDPAAAKAEAKKAEQAIAIKVSDSQLDARLSPADAAYERYYVSALAQRTDAFTWQAFASRVIFWMVIVLVMSGLSFSGVQFWIALRRGTLGAPEELELSLQTLKVRSQFLGVVTLSLSIVFFYLYLATVYPIVNVGKSESAARPKP